MVSDVNIKFGYSKSSRYKKLVKLASSIPTYKNINGVHSLSLSFSEFYKNFKEVSRLLDKIHYWTHAEIKIQGKGINSYYDFIKIASCYAKKLNKEHCTRVETEVHGHRRFPKLKAGSGWGCMHLNSIYMTISPKAWHFEPGNGLYWFEHGKRVGNEWIIDKEAISTKLFAEAQKKELSICPAFKASTITKSIENLPDSLEIGKDWVMWNPIIDNLASIDDEAGIIVPATFATKTISANARYDESREFFRENYRQNRAKEERKEALEDAKEDARRAEFIKRIKKEYRDAKKLLSFYESVQYYHNYQNDPIDLVKKFERFSYNYKKFKSLQKHGENSKDPIASFHCDMILFFCMNSFENYKPALVSKVIKEHYQKLGGDRNDNYGWLGSGITDVNGKAKGTSGQAHLLQGLVLGLADYYILNLDFVRLEKHLVEFRRNIHHDIMEELIIVLAVELKRDPHHSLIALSLCGDYNVNISKYNSMSYAWTITSFERQYLKMKNLPLLSNALIEICSDVIKDQKKKWFLNNYINKEPKGILRNPEKKLFWTLYYEYETPYPSFHPYRKQGIPDNSAGRHDGRYKEIKKESELFVKVRNVIRQGLGLPNVSEGWIGERNLLIKLKTWFPKEEIVHQWSPKWLGRQRIDIGFPERSMAIEFHGTQHFEPVEYFGGKEAFREQQHRDALKKQLCIKNKVTLIVFTHKDKDSEIKKIIRNVLKSSPKNRR